MKAKVTEQGLLIPKQLLEGIQEVDIRKHLNVLVIVPVANGDRILQLGSQPIIDSVDDASMNHDLYLYNLLPCCSSTQVKGEVTATYSLLGLN